MTTAAVIVRLLAAEWATRPPTTGRHHAPQTYRLPCLHSRTPQHTETTK